MPKKEERKEIGYYNNSTRRVSVGYSTLFHSLSKTASELDENGYVQHRENIGGHLRQVKINLKGQLKLDHANRGGKRLWTRIYTKEDLEAKLQESGVVVHEEKKAKKKPQVKNPPSGDSSQEGSLEEALAG